MITNFKFNSTPTHLGYYEAIGLDKCIRAYIDNCSSDVIMEVGFNPEGNYVYIALESFVTIRWLSSYSTYQGYGNSKVEYLVKSVATNETKLFDDYNSAIHFDRFGN